VREFRRGRVVPRPLRARCIRSLDVRLADHDRLVTIRRKGREVPRSSACAMLDPGGGRGVHGSRHVRYPVGGDVLSGYVHLFVQF
jgi:hypothetical protein